MSTDRRYALLQHNHDTTYLTIADAASTYLTIATAASTYLPLTGGTLTGDLTVSSTGPSFRLYESDGPADEKWWRFTASAGTLYLQARVDDYSSSTSPLVITRTGTTINTMQLNTALLQVSNSCVMGGSAASSSVSASSTYLSVNSNAASGTVRLEVFTNDGTNSQRLWMFSDDNANYVGFDYTYATGLNGFQMRRAGTAWLSLNALGTILTITPAIVASGTVTVADATADAHAINKGQADALYAPIASGGGGTVASQAANLSIASNTTYQDTDCLIALAVGTYAIEACYSATSHVTPDMDVQLAFTGTTTSVNVVRTANRGTAVSSNQTTTLPNAYNMNETASYIVTYDGVIVVSVAGDLKLQAKQTTSSATAVTFNKGSYLRVTAL